MKSSTGETSTFMLSGKSTEPLAEGHLVLETAARQPVTQVIRVPNVLVDRDVVYDISTEVGVLGGEATLTVRANGTGTYEVTASPIFTGAQKGTLTFTAQQSNGEYIFYTCEIITKPPPESGNLDLAVEPGKAVLMQLPIGNPLKGTLEFTVHTEGSSLYAPHRISVPSHERKVLELAYCPTAPAETWGQLRLNSAQLGEFRFGLGLKCMDGVPESAYSQPPRAEADPPRIEEVAEADLEEREQFEELAGSARHADAGEAAGGADKREDAGGSAGPLSDAAAAAASEEKGSAAAGGGIAEEEAGLWESLATVALSDSAPAGGGGGGGSGAGAEVSQAFLLVAAEEEEGQPAASAASNLDVAAAAGAAVDDDNPL